MSGGSLNYAYGHIEELAREITRRADLPLHKAFAKHLMRVAKAARDLEWVWSCDYGEGAEEEAIKACMDWKKETRVQIREDIAELKKQLELLEQAAV